MAQGEDVTAIRDAMNRLQQATYRTSDRGRWCAFCRIAVRPGMGTGTAMVTPRRKTVGEDVVEGEFRRV